VSGRRSAPFTLPSAAFSNTFLSGTDRGVGTRIGDDPTDLADWLRDGVFIRAALLASRLWMISETEVGFSDADFGSFLELRPWY
jgi:hypothetical protein